MEKIYEDISKVLITREQIRKRVEIIGKQIAKDYAGQELVLVGILKGSVVFLSDLMRNIDQKIDLDFMVISSYESGTKSSGNIKIIKDINIDIKDKCVLIVEDIVDTGITLSHLKKIFKVRKCKSFKICTLLDKKQRRQINVKADYIGFDVPDEFLVGYGLDYNGKYRNLPDIAVLKDNIIAN